MEKTNLKPGEPTIVSGSVNQIIKSIARNFNLAIVQPELIKKDCDKLRRSYDSAITNDKDIDLTLLYPLLHKRSGPIAEYVFDFLVHATLTQEDLNPIVEALLRSRDKKLVSRALDIAVKLADCDRLKVSNSFVEFLAEQLENDSVVFSSLESINKISSIVRKYKPENESSNSDPILTLYLEEDNLDMRRLAAKILDKDEDGIKPDNAEKILGKKPALFFLPYFEYTNASHSDLLCFQTTILEHLMDDFIQSKKVIGDRLLCEAISKIGWERLNLGFQAQALTGVSIGGSPPFMISDLEASFFNKCQGANTTSKLYLIVACGGKVSNEQSNDYENDPITRFRSYNLNHASLLSDFLDVGPLHVEKVRDMIRRMDMIVQDYVILFERFSDECSILPSVYQKIKHKILKELDDHMDRPQFSADLTRIVQSFEEPKSVGDVRTLHGLKRYLHQQGLSMGFKLVEGGRSPNRTVDILLASEGGIKFVFSKIRFADFESHRLDQSQAPKIPYSVKLLLDGFVQQMLHGQEKFPGVDIFCYGNEVHYYFGFRNHPAFLRIDYAPPLRGGMIDLEYFGVSSYELNQHPNISLDAIRAFFQQIEFEIKIDSVRIHARYDKERALTLGDLCRKASRVFQLAPYFMDLDWIIGSLDLKGKAKKKVTNAWIYFFLRWGFLPLKSVVTKDRLGILRGYDLGPTGQHEIVWPGEGKYSDVYTGLPPEGTYDSILNNLREQGLEIAFQSGKEGVTHPGQIEIEKRVLVPLHQAVDRGEFVLSLEGIKLQLPTLFKRVHETEIFAELLASGIENISQSIGTARLVRPMERSIKFNTTGGVNGYKVQTSVLVLRGEEISFFVLRGAKDMIRLAFFTRDPVVYKKRESEHCKWISNVSYDAKALAELLRVNDFIDGISLADFTKDEQKAAKFLGEIQQSVLPPGQAPLKGERIVSGLKASPGNSVGKALFGTEGRNPQDFRGSILVATSIRPEDTTFLYYADGIISTGGGILSHAGLIAMQFRKPALIIAGKWHNDSSGRKILSFKSVEYKVTSKKINEFNICRRTDVEEKEYTLREGDLLILDTLAGNMRVLGQENDILALYEGFRLYNSSNQLLATVNNEREILGLRGKLLRARHQLQNVLRRCTAPVTARYAVFEILLNGAMSGIGMSYRDKYFLLSVLLNNEACAHDVGVYLRQIMIELRSGFTDAVHKALDDMPTSEYTFEILYLRLDIIHQRHAIESAEAALTACGLKPLQKEDFDKKSIEALTIDRLSKLRKKLNSKIKYDLERGRNDFRMRHLLRQLDRLNSILPVSPRGSSAFKEINELKGTLDNKKLIDFADHLIIDSDECGFELYNYIGWKAANLAEIGRLSKEDLVPPWFVVTDMAFKEMMQSEIKEISPSNGDQHEYGISLREAIDKILKQADINNKQKSRQIRNLWERTKLPDNICDAVIEAYWNIIGKDAPDDTSGKSLAPVYVAVRSSSLEEDTEAAAHAGEFETYLYIHGDDQLLYYLKQTWSGLWTERAIHNRAMTGDEAELKGGGVIVQRMVNSRVSGVLQTVNIPKGNIREMVINAGLGLGEGVVSGTVAADQVTVTKGVDPEKELLRFSYITSDKTMQIVFNHHAGFGTIKSQTIYHQRLRPAMEYVELCQLVRNAASLEKAYGYPLDIEFGIEDDHLWILQARPVASFSTVINETLERFPLNKSIDLSDKI